MMPGALGALGALGAAVAVSLCVAGCAARPAATSATASCRGVFAQADAIARQAGTADGGAFGVEGFPYLRTDRFLASFAPEVGDGPRFEAWLGRMRALDLERRTIELRNAGVREPAAMLARLEACGGTLAREELARPADRNRLREAAGAPDDYSLVARVLGLYPVALPFINAGLDSRYAQLRRDHALPVDGLDFKGKLVTWSLAGQLPADRETVKHWLGAAPRDALGIPELGQAQWDALLSMHAPVWWIEESGPSDRPGTPRAGNPPGFDPASPVVHSMGTFTRFGSEILPALVYVLWFSDRPKGEDADDADGTLDGIVWRTVLGRDGRPLLHDTIRPCGCFHAYYPVADGLWPRKRGSFWDPAILLPQPDVPPGSRIAIRVQARTHQVRRVVAHEVPAGESRSYELRPYADLTMLPTVGDGTRSLFDEHGIVRGTERRERWWLWMTGVRSAGAMRQYGRHATSFVGRSHFDDARALERAFDPPGAPEAHDKDH